jgi:3-deoxy-D-manno-octulosonic acid (KDO) 8-phosphate synthase
MSDYVMTLAESVRNNLNKMEELIGDFHRLNIVKKSLTKIAKNKINSSQCTGLNHELRVAMSNYNENAYRDLVIATLKIMFLETARNLKMAKSNTETMQLEEECLKQIEIKISQLSR